MTLKTAVTSDFISMHPVIVGLHLTIDNVRLRFVIRKGSAAPELNGNLTHSLGIVLNKYTTYVENCFMVHYDNSGW